jgi:N-acetylglutamate synthase-like GNAT family acetyltransferase
MLRLARAHDLTTINALIQRSARELSQADYANHEIEAAIQFILGVDTQLIRDQTYYVIEAHSLLIACGGWSKRRTLFGGDQLNQRDDALLDPKMDAAKIRAFFVHPAYARQGLGKQLLHHCETMAWSQGFKSMELLATLPGVKLYSAYGYTTIQEINRLATKPS